MTKRHVDFASEGELCAAFIEWAKPQGFTAYAETAGWDILLVASDGRQTGVQAKQRANFKVLAQTIETNRYAASGSEYYTEAGPDHRAILVPRLEDGVRSIMACLGISVYYYSGCGRFSLDCGDYLLHPVDWNPLKRCELPDYVPDVPAGVPSPVLLTPWKVGALRVLAHLEVHGSIDRNLVRGYGNDPRRWCATDGWLVAIGGGSWTLGKAPRFDLQHPDVYIKVKAEIAQKKGGLL